MTRYSKLRAYFAGSVATALLGAASWTALLLSILAAAEPALGRKSAKATTGRTLKELFGV